MFYRWNTLLVGDLICPTQPRSRSFSAQTESLQLLIHQLNVSMCLHPWLDVLAAYFLEVVDYSQMCGWAKHIQYKQSRDIKIENWGIKSLRINLVRSIQSGDITISWGIQIFPFHINHCRHSLPPDTWGQPKLFLFFFTVCILRLGYKQRCHCDCCSRNEGKEEKKKRERKKSRDHRRGGAASEGGNQFRAQQYREEKSWA